MNKEKIEELVMKALSKLYIRATKDLILIPRPIRIWIDIGFAVVIFAGMVLLPLWYVIELRFIGSIDVAYILVGLFLTQLFLFFAYRATKKERGR
jgi:hypothetical protein